MTTYGPIQVDPRLDLVLERTIDIPRDLVWRAWTTPDLVKRWFTPAPWQTPACEIDLRPGGAFRTTMRGPEGQEFSGASCYLEVIPRERLVWTTALEPGFRPKNPAEGDFNFTAAILLADAEGGTRYTAIAMHVDEASAKRHADMGFHTGWGAALDQLVACMKG